MILKKFWTDKRIDTVSKIFLNIGQAIVLSALIGGLLDKINATAMKTIIIIAMMVSLTIGVILSDIKRSAKEV